MSDPKIVASGRNKMHPGGAPADSSPSWAVLGWIGLAFLIVGGSDFALVWFPLNFGDPEWEFGTVTQSFNGLPILLLGLGLLVAAAVQLERRWWANLGLAGAAVLLFWVVAGFVLWANRVPLALETVPDELVVGVQRAVAKTLLQAIAYSLALGFLVRRSWTAAKRDAGGPDSVR